IHTRVTAEIVRQIEAAKENGKISLFFVEAALLIENGFDKICDEMWYIYADEKVRRERLAVSRGYNGEKITAIMEKQLPESEFRKNCQVVIDNSGALSESIRQIDQILEAYQWQR
ncbi:MAG: dephospho-CoA kinase, partial [Lachnospiraceae bacterium]|nr:dephospho-CoA kinase [Lachnospiraceae bacterium]